jgi:hypothetical protein
MPETDADTLFAKPMPPETSFAQAPASTPSASLTEEPTLLSAFAPKDSLDQTATKPTTSAPPLLAPTKMPNAETEDVFARLDSPAHAATAEMESLLTHPNALAKLLTKDLASTTTNAPETSSVFLVNPDLNVSAHHLSLDPNAARLDAFLTPTARAMPSAWSKPRTTFVLIASASLDSLEMTAPPLPLAPRTSATQPEFATTKEDACALPEEPETLALLPQTAESSSSSSSMPLAEPLSPPMMYCSSLLPLEELMLLL